MSSPRARTVAAPQAPTRRRGRLRTRAGARYRSLRSDRRSRRRTAPLIAAAATRPRPELAGIARVAILRRSGHSPLTSSLSGCTQESIQAASDWRANHDTFEHQLGARGVAPPALVEGDLEAEDCFARAQVAGHRDPLPVRLQRQQVQAPKLAEGGADRAKELGVALHRREGGSAPPLPPRRLQRQELLDRRRVLAQVNRRKRGFELVLEPPSLAVQLTSVLPRDRRGSVARLERRSTAR